MDVFRLDGKTALVTGGSSGLGLGMAKSLARAGASVVILARSQTRLDNALAALQQINPACSAFSCDLADIPGIPECCRRIEEQWGPIDILVNNAGMNMRGRADEIDIADWDAVIRVNLTAPFALSQAWAKRRIAEESGGCIIFTSSLTAEATRPTLAAYTSSKGGIRQLIKALAVDWAPFGIRVNGIAPGYFKTELNRPLHENEEFSAWIEQRTPMSRWGVPDDLGPTAVFLASDAARFITGQTIFVDGGWMASF